MSRCVLSLFLVLLPFSLLAAGHDLTPPPAAANQLRPVVTGNGSGFTAAWYEQASSRYSVASSVVNANGEPIDGGSATADQKAILSMAIAHSPSGALVAWTAADGNLFAERLSPSGMPLGVTVVTSGNAYASDIAVVWNGSRYFVIWLSGSQLLGAFVAPDGSSTAPRPFFSEAVPSGQGPPRLPVTPGVTWDGRQFIAVFGEVSNFCIVTCPAFPPDQFRVMRLSADGDAIDSSPAIITGSHLRAHIASNGTESLIALDGVRDVSTIVAHTESGLTLDAETPVFGWGSEVASDVVWDGAMFRVGWRYAGAVASWIGMAQVAPSGRPVDYRFAPAGSLVPTYPLGSGGPSMAVNDAGVTAVAISEGASPSSLPRARLYLASELAPMPSPPPAPRNVISYFSGVSARVDWQADDQTAGFAIDAWSAWDNTWYLFRVVPGDARTTTIYTSPGGLFRIRALGPGGVSEGAITSIGSMPRRRADRH